MNAEQSENTSNKGQLGEDVASAFLRDKGYEIIERNWRIGEGEIDIIAKTAQTIVFVEVKTAYSDKFGDPLEWVNSAKQRQIGKMAAVWIERHKVENCWFRFDVLALTKKDNGFQVKHIEDAFML